MYKYQEDNLKQYFSDAGFNSLDSILVFIETNIQHFAEFKNTANWTTFKTSFIPTVKILEEIPYNIAGSRLTFLSLKPHLAFIEDTTIRKTLGEEIYQEIKTEMVKDSPAAKVTAILPFIRKPLIYFATARLMEETGATLGNKGLFFEKLEGNTTDNKIKQPSTETRTIAVVNKNHQIGNIYLGNLKSHLIAKSEDWSQFEGEIGSVLTRDNTEKKTFWA